MFSESQLNREKEIKVEPSTGDEPAATAQKNGDEPRINSAADPNIYTNAENTLG